MQTKIHRLPVRLLLCLLAWCCLMSAVLLASPKALAASSSASVTDHAGVFTASELQSLNTQLEEARETLGIQNFVIVTESSISGQDRQTYAEQYYASHYGSASGVLLFLCMESGNRGWYTYVEGNLHTNYTEKIANKVDDALSDYMVNGQYYPGISNWISNMTHYLSGAGSMDWLTGALPLAIPLGVIVGGIVFLIVLFRIRKSMKPIQHQTHAGLYLNSRASEMQKQGNIFLYATTVVHRKPKPRGGGPGGSSFSAGSHSSGSGRSF